MKKRSIPAAPSVFRLTQIQVFNWGTFSGLHTIPVAARGHLFVGPSGSGKSTLLDVFTTLLVPPALRQYNVAAREGERGNARDRTLASYIRGAWAEIEDTDIGRPVQQYLRQNAAWSAIALTYVDADGQTVVLVGVFWLKKSSANTGNLYLVFSEPFDLDSLQATGPNVRKIKHGFPNAFASSHFSEYSNKLLQKLHIPSPMALRLLQKAQSAKNLGDLNLFLRDFMLDPPQTFAAAEQLVQSFQELETTYQAVVNVRKQIQQLIPARDGMRRYEELQSEHDFFQKENDGLDRYMAELSYNLWKRRITDLSAEKAEAETKVETARQAVADQRDLIQRRRFEYNAQGGEALKLIDQELSQLAHQLPARKKQQEIASQSCRTLGLELPSSAEEFARLQAECRMILESKDEECDADREMHEQLLAEKTQLKNRAHELDAEIQAMERQPSLIPSRFLAIRSDIARALGCSDKDLPFAGELMEVLTEESEWRGAIERVLRPLSLSILAEEGLYQAFTRYVNHTHLGRKLEYHRARDLEQRKRDSSKALYHKLRFAEHPLSDWLEAKIAGSHHFVCVDNLTEFSREDFAVTREGLSRSGRSRHVKDDTFHVNDSGNWIMGFDNRDKLAQFKLNREQLESLIKTNQTKLDAIVERDKERGRQTSARMVLTSLLWDAIDVGGLSAKIDIAEKTKARILEGADGLARLAEELENSEHELREVLEPAQKKCEADLTILTNTLENARVKMEKAELDCEQLPALDPDTTTALLDRQRHCHADPSSDELPGLLNKMRLDITKDLKQIAQSLLEVEKGIEKTLERYKESWNVIAADFQPNLAGAQDFLQHLERLEQEELVRHEDNFLNLLRKQGMQHLVALSEQLDREHKDIHERLALVNNGLKDVEYSPGSHLSIRPQDLHNETVRQFKDDMANAFSHALDDLTSVDSSVLEERYLALNNIVNRLKSQDAEAIRWRELVLDVRRHVEFIGLERIDATGEVRTHRGSQGKSGGQRQKLTATCLAAALRYQLGGVEGVSPAYTTVALDEAFDKADHDFTRQVMTIFASFGFQMIISTPMKSVRTLEPFIGGACVVNIRDDRHSSVCGIEYDVAACHLLLDHPGEAASTTEPAPNSEDIAEVPVSFETSGAHPNVPDNKQGYPA